MLIKGLFWVCPSWHTLTPTFTQCPIRGHLCSELLASKGGSREYILSCWICLVSGSLLSENLYQEPAMDSLVISMQLNRNSLVPVSLDGWKTETSIHFYQALQTWVILRMTCRALKNVECRALLSEILTQKVWSRAWEYTFLKWYRSYWSAEFENPWSQ